MFGRSPVLFWEKFKGDLIAGPPLLFIIFVAGIRPRMPAEVQERCRELLLDTFKGQEKVPAPRNVQYSLLTINLILMAILQAPIRPHPK